MPTVVVAGIGLDELGVPPVAETNQFKVQFVDAVAFKAAITVSFWQ
jgi:hypothetical protein